MTSQDTYALAIIIIMFAIFAGSLLYAELSWNSHESEPEQADRQKQDSKRSR